MQWRDALLRLRALLVPRKMEQELLEELQFHLEMQARKNQRHDLNADEANHQARLAFGSIAQATEECRDVRGIHLLETLAQDIRYGTRMLRKSPGTSAAAILILALGIGSATVLFSLVYAIVLQPFPYKDFERCITFSMNAITQDQPINSRRWFYLPEIVAFRDQNRVFEDVAGYYNTNIEWTDSNTTRETRGAFVTANTFDLLGMSAYQGRTITPRDGDPDSAPVFIMNYRLWKNDFGGDPGIVGKSFHMNGKARTLVGIMPPRFQFADGAAIWLPLSLDPGAEGHFIGPNLPVGLHPIARLRPDVQFDRATADLDLILHQFAKIPPSSGRLPYPARFTIAVERLRDAVAGNFKKPLYALFGAVIMLLLIACGNVANLLLSRATARKREIAVRAALGASRSRLLQQLFIEVCVLSTAACISGCALAYVGLRGVVAAIPARAVPPEVSIELNPAILLFAIAATLVTTVLSGMAPAVYSAGGGLRAKLASSQAGTTADLRRGQFRSALVVFEMALSIVLLVGAGLMIRTFFALTHVELGFDQNRLIYARIAVPKTRSSRQKQVFFQELLDRLKSTPGVASAATVAQLPTSGGAFPNDLKVLGQGTRTYNGMFDLCSAEIFQALGLRLLRGRLLSEEDVSSARLVAVVNRTLARHYFDEQDPIGQKIAFRTFDFIPDAPHGAYFEIVGVVSDFHNARLREPVIPEAFLPYTITAGGGRTILVRTAVDPKSLSTTISRQVASIDTAASVNESGVFQDVIDSQVKEPRFELITLNSFAAIGLLIAIGGVFSVMAYNVSQQTHEIGIRMALGASQRTILGMVMGKALMLVGLGASCGVVASFWFTRFIASQLWGVSTRDTLTFGASICLILVLGAVASLPPARRAVSVNPMLALRYE
jgi:putative ABC transport system permease protein